MEHEALKLALEALEELNNTNSHWWQEVDRATIDKIDPAIIAIKEALVQPTQEPMAWQWLGSAHFRKKLPKNADITAWNPLYTSPPQRPWVGLTEKDFSAINQSCLTKLQAATSAESILKEKNNGGR